MQNSEDCSETLAKRNPIFETLFEGLRDRKILSLLIFSHFNTNDEASAKSFKCPSQSLFLYEGCKGFRSKSASEF